MREFMFAQIDATGEWALYLAGAPGMDLADPTIIACDDVHIDIVPAFMLSELRAAFIVGFKIAHHGD